MTKQEMTNLIYDTLMGNTNNPQFKTHFVDNQEINDPEGLIAFEYGTNGKKYLVTVHEIDTVGEDYDILARENKAMAEALKKHGYTDAQISDIANGAI